MKRNSDQKYYYKTLFFQMDTAIGHYWQNIITLYQTKFIDLD